MTEHFNKTLRASITALSGYLSLIGVLYQRAEINNQDAKKKQRLENYKSRYAIKNGQNYDYEYAAYTALAIEDLSELLPNCIQIELAEFIDNTAGFLIENKTIKQTMLAEALQTAIGFEVDMSMTMLDKNENQANVFLTTLFEKIKLTKEGEKNNTSQPFKYHYPLQSLSVNAIFPVESNRKITLDEGKKAYQTLWEQLKLGLKRLKDTVSSTSEEEMLLWLDAFDSLWLTIAHAIPASVKYENASHVSLYDLSKTTASLLVSLEGANKKSIMTECEHSEISNTSLTNEKPYLLIQGDFFGIQDFIFTSGGSSNKQANKLLRGRSFYVSLISELASLYILENLNLPSTCQVMNAAGKFTIVSPNTPTILQRIDEIKQVFNNWFLKHTYGISGIGLAVTEASRADFTSNDDNGKSRFSELQTELFTQLEKVKYQRFNLTDKQSTNVFKHFLDEFNDELGVCEVDGRSPASLILKGTHLGLMAHDHIKLGAMLVSNKPLICLSRVDLLAHNLGIKEQQALKINIFGYWVIFLDKSQDKSLLSILMQSGHVARCWDIGLPKLNQATTKNNKGTNTDELSHLFFDGYAKRFINGYVPYFEKEILNNDFVLNKYEKNSRDEIDSFTLKSLQHIACEDKTPPLNVDGGQWLGVNALHTLKGDVDDLGAIFQSGLKNASFAKMASLSRQVNFFFSLWLPAYCSLHSPNMYTVFAGGDDFFLIGPWKSTTLLAVQMQKSFTHYVAFNPEIHFSAGLIQTKSSVPIRFLSEQAESALEQAKSHSYCLGESSINQVMMKNSVNIYGLNTSWDALHRLIESAERLKELKENEGLSLSTAYIYGLLELSEMAGDKNRPEAGLWRSYLIYRTQRNVIDKMKKNLNETKEAFLLRQKMQSNKLLTELGSNLTNFQNTYKIALQHLLYQYREQ